MSGVRSESESDPAEGKDRDNSDRTASDAGETIKETIAEKQAEAAEQIDHIASAAHDAARRLGSEEQWASGLIERAASGLSDIASTLRRNDLGSLLGRANRFARNQPVLFASAAFAVGFAMTRVARAGLEAGADDTTARERGNGH